MEKPTFGFVKNKVAENIAKLHKEGKAKATRLSRRRLPFGKIDYLVTAEAGGENSAERTKWSAKEETFVRAWTDDGAIQAAEKKGRSFDKLLKQ